MVWRARFCRLALALGLAGMGAGASADDGVEAREPLQLASRAPAAVSVAAAAHVAVIYPKLDEPFGTVFRQIVSGIESVVEHPVVSIALGGSDAVDTVEATLREQGTRVVIALGRHGLEVATSLADRLPVVGGAVLASPVDASGADAVVSLTPDPDLLFRRLAVLSPHTRRVFVVHSRPQSDWLITLARRSADGLGIELVAAPADDRRAALLAFQEIMREARPMDAIWLPQDALVVDRDVILPYVLQQAWDRSLVLFSSTLGHVQRGALFALYPDNRRMGERLASSALSLTERRGGVARVEPLRELLAAVNVRTAGHLGLALDDRLGDYALTFPVR
ncbi:MAG: hypothetical protein KDH20_03140 [Rhodocyclaceae bacterium]|nr:hypothetical protein [Rhodocyclaceae bacterium]